MQKCHSQVIYDTYFDPQYGARGTARTGSRVSTTTVGKLKRPRRTHRRARVQGGMDDAPYPTDIPHNDDPLTNAPAQGHSSTALAAQGSHANSSDHDIKMRIHMAMEQCYGAEDRRTLDAKAEWERALRAHRQAQDEDARAEKRLLESKQHMERLQRDLDRAQKDVLTQRTLICTKQDEFVREAARLGELERDKQRLATLVQEADHAHRKRAQQIFTADSTRDARERHTRAICTLLGEDTPRNLPVSHV